MLRHEALATTNMRSADQGGHWGEVRQLEARCRDLCVVMLASYYAEHLRPLQALSDIEQSHCSMFNGVCMKL